MLTVIMGIVAYTLLSAFIKVEETKINKAWEESAGIDWNKYYANMN